MRTDRDAKRARKRKQPDDDVGSDDGGAPDVKRPALSLGATPVRVAAAKASDTACAVPLTGRVSAQPLNFGEWCLPHYIPTSLKMAGSSFRPYNVQRFPTPIVTHFVVFVRESYTVGYTPVAIGSGQVYKWEDVQCIAREMETKTDHEFSAFNAVVEVFQKGETSSELLGTLPVRSHIGRRMFEWLCSNAHNIWFDVKAPRE